MMMFANFPLSFMRRIVSAAKRAWSANESRIGGSVGRPRWVITIFRHQAQRFCQMDFSWVILA